MTAERELPAEVRITLHEAVCAERYAKIIEDSQEIAARISRIEQLLIAAFASLLVGLAGLVITLLTKAH